MPEPIYLFDAQLGDTYYHLSAEGDVVRSWYDADTWQHAARKAIGNCYLSTELAEAYAEDMRLQVAIARGLRS